MSHVYRFITGLLQPFPLLPLLVLAAALLLWRRRESRRRLVLLTVAVLLLTLACLPPVGYVAMGTLEWRYPLEPPPLDGVEAIVVLGGGMHVYDDEGKHYELGDSTVMRCLHAARLYRDAGGLPVVVSGGKVLEDRPGPPLGQAMREFLVRTGVDPNDIRIEDTSTTTYENAVDSRELLQREGITRVALVTDAAHMLRASLCFQKQGLDVVPAPCNWRATRFEVTAFTFLPSLDAARGVQAAFHEWLGLLWYRIHGRI